jgi:hypothetical protein
MLIVTSVIFLGLLSTIPVYLAGKSYENPSVIFMWAPYFTAIAFIAMKLILMTALTVFFSSFTSSSFISLVLSIATYLIGSTTEAVKGLLDAKMEGIDISPAVALLIKSAYYIFPNLAAFDMKQQAAYGLPLPEGYLTAIPAYWFLYCAILISAAALIIRRREFP